jgi:hypothetical protein
MYKHLEGIRKISYLGFVEYEWSGEVGGQWDRTLRPIHLGGVARVPQFEDQTRISRGIRDRTEDGSGGKQGVRAQKLVAWPHFGMRPTLDDNRSSHPVPNMVSDE